LFFCVLPADPCAPLPFYYRREAEIHFALRHENIVRVLAFSEGSPQSPPFLVMERMEESLSGLLEIARNPLPLGARFEIVKDICQVLFRNSLECLVTGIHGSGPAAACARDKRTIC